MDVIVVSCHFVSLSFSLCALATAIMMLIDDEIVISMMLFVVRYALSMLESEKSIVPSNGAEQRVVTGIFERNWIR